MTFTVSSKWVSASGSGPPLRVEFDRSVSATVSNPFFTGTAHNTRAVRGWNTEAVSVIQVV